MTILVTGGCGVNKTENDAALPVSLSENTPVTVETKDLVATSSTSATVTTAATFGILTSQRSAFTPEVNVGMNVRKGDRLGTAGEQILVAPVDAKVVGTADASADLPANFPVFSLQYEGFSLPFTDNLFPGLSEAAEISGAFQIKDALGPADCIAVVRSLSTSSRSDSYDQADDEFAEENGSEPLKTNGLLCLIDKDTPVSQDQQATLVLHGVKRTGVLALPVTAVAGRLNQGKVSLLQGKETKQVDVELGISDGAYIEIISGLQAGDQVAAIAPNLDPRVG